MKIRGKYKYLILYIIIIILFFNKISYAERIEQKYYTIFFSQKDTKFAKEISEEFNNIQGTINKEVGFYDVEHINLIICATKKELKEYLKRSEHIPDQAIAIAIPSKYKIIIYSPRDMPPGSDFYKVLTHEYNHILLYAISGGSYIPLWFNEGFAQYFAKQWNFNREIKFVKNSLMGDILSLERYNYSYPLSNIRIDLFYMQSYYTIKYLINQYSAKKFRIFLEELHKYKNFKKVFFRIYGITLKSFLEKTKRTIKKYIILKLFYSGFGFIWFLIPFLLIIVYLVKRFKRKKIESKWIEEDFRKDNNRNFEKFDNNI